MQEAQTELNELVYNDGMPPKKKPEMEPLPDVDLIALCEFLESLTGYSARQMSELLGISQATYLHWNWTRPRTDKKTRSKNTNPDGTEKINTRGPSGDVAAKIFVLKAQIEKDRKISIPVPFKNIMRNCT